MGLDLAGLRTRAGWLWVGAFVIASSTIGVLAFGRFRTKEPRRRITEEQRTRILTRLRDFPLRPGVEICWLEDAGPEPHRYAREVAGVFDRAGWEVRKTRCLPHGFVSRTSRGLAVGGEYGDGEPSRDVVATFHDAGIPVEEAFIDYRGIPPYFGWGVLPVRIFVGSKPE
jgi:hypothetical protein